MNVLVLIENSGVKNLACEHGLSLYIQYNGKNYLYDAGASNKFIKNAKLLNISLENVDYSILSHGHYDHSNGYKEFFKINSKAKVWVSENIKPVCYSKHGMFHHYIGVPKKTFQENQKRFVNCGGITLVHEGVFILAHNRRKEDQQGKKSGLMIRQNKKYFWDDFSHEQTLIIREDCGLIIFNSCSHIGVVNVLEEVRQAFPGEEIHSFFGGFHLMGNGGAKTMKDKKDEIIRLGNEINKFGLKGIYTGHCTGTPAYDILKTVLGESLHKMPGGTYVEIGE